MDKNEVIGIVSAYALLLKPHFALNKVILYGSYARNESNDRSDIDVAVVVNSVEGDYFTYTPLLWKLRRRIDSRIEPVLFVANEDESGFLEEILSYGIEVPVE
jgi:predicted nucleotidyltransferase